MIELANDRWFPIVNAGLAMVAASLWYLSSGRVGWPLLVVILVPWILRIVAGHFPYRRSRFDGWLFLFGATAVFSTFTAYNSELAQGKFWILVGATAVYLAIVSVSRRDIWLLAGATGPVGALLSFYFVMSNNWQQWPADIGLLNRIGMAWMSLRPTLPLRVVHPNTLAGMMALLLPFTIAFGIFAWHKRRIRWVQLAGVSSAIIIGGLVFTSSLGAWLALAVGLSVWGLWQISSWLHKKTPFSQRLLFLGLMLLLFVTGTWMFNQLLGTIANQQASATRLGLAQQTLYLIQDFALTGSGLGSFPALYSQYIQVIPQFFVAYSNLYLDIWLEQGLFALVAMMAILAGSFWLLFKRSAFTGAKEKDKVANIKSPVDGLDLPLKRKRRRRKDVDKEEIVLFQWAAFVSLLVMVLHGLSDDALYGNLASPLLFFAPAMVILVTRKRSDPAAPLSVQRKRWAVGIGVTAVLLVGLFFGFRQTVEAQWHANRGALALARAELGSWPTNQWDSGGNLERFAAAKIQLEQALAIDPDNRTANHRMGIIAMVARDYETAVTYLEEAQLQTEGHRGIIKSLGYSYVWTSQFDEAKEVLQPIQEARAEMAVYSNWWGRQNRHDLAVKASEMVPMLENPTLSSR